MLCLCFVYYAGYFIDILVYFGLKVIGVLDGDDLIWLYLLLGSSYLIMC